MADPSDWTAPYREGKGHCHACGGDNAYWESDAEGASCPDCGGNDADDG
jgi:hypothetical protein